MIMKGKNVIILTTSFTHGGAEKHGLLLADYFKNSLNLNVEFWAFRAGTKVLSDQAEGLGIPTKVIGAPPRVGRYLGKIHKAKAVKVFKDFNPDVIIALNREANLYIANIGKLTGAKSLVWSIQTAFDCEDLNESEIRSLNNIDLFLSNSQHGIKYMRDKFALPSDKFHFIKNGFSMEIIENSKVDYRALVGANENDFLITMVGHIEDRKDHLSLIRSIKPLKSKLSSKGINPVLILAGKLGTDIEKLIAETIELGVYRNVKFLGPIKNVPDLLRNVDLYVMSSVVEGMPNAVIEAMHYGLPIVANDEAGNMEALDYNNRDFIAESNNPESLAEKMSFLILNRDKAIELGKRNEEYARKNYTSDKLGSDTWKVISKSI